ncbi:MAG TPA: hypothetical protein VEI83_10165 [Acidimicrobiales bacterium]|nr:hypothetical protein [Acidimicrobiales bacterium]
MEAPRCPHCGEPVTRALDLPYGWWEWQEDGYQLMTASARVDTAPWVHWDCMGELRQFHPHDVGEPKVRAKAHAHRSGSTPS